jgi:GNAT superfamily N-acetyltransferase
MFGGSLGGILAVNNYMGRGVHVPDIPEATNRIVVDLSEGVLRKQDVGFVAISTSDDEGDKRIFAPTNGVIATVDAQHRNSPDSPEGVRTVEGLPSHLHIKNMDVHYKKRRKGIGRALVELIIDYAKTKTDAKVLTL